MSLCSDRAGSHPPLNSWSLASIDRAHRKDSRMFVGLASKDGRLNIGVYFLSLPKLINTTVKGFLKGHKDNKNRRQNNSNEGLPWWCSG